MKNLSLKVFSLLVAVLLSYFVNSESNTSVINFVVPIEVRNIPAGQTILSQTQSQVQVGVKGPSFLVARVASSPPIFRISLPPDVGGRYVATLEPADLALPPYVQVLNMEPRQIEFTFDALSTKTLPVSVPRVGSLPDDLRLDDQTVDPDRVTASGPATEVEPLTKVETYPLDLRDIRGSTRRELNVKSPSRLVDLSHTQVRVSLQISSPRIQLSLQKVPVEVRASAGQKYAVEPSVVDLVVAGPQTAVSRIKKDKLFPFVRIKDSPESNTELNVSLDLPKNLEVISIDPPTVKVIK